MHRILAVGALLVSVGIPSHGMAQTAGPLPRVTEEVVVTATLTPVTSELVGRTVTSLTREELQRLGISSLIEALRLAPAVDAKARGPRDVQTDFSIRGATFGQSLVLFDGFRLNDSQSGHHNGEIPIPLAAVDRIEVVAGPGSAVHGADALGGTINVLPRRDAYAVGNFNAGQHGYVSSQASVSGRGLPESWTLTGWGARSAGFTFDRDFLQGGAAIRAGLSPSLVLDARHQRRAFGANGFYGASPSKEWTDQTLQTAAWRHVAGAWLTQLRGLYRNHGDHFRWDIARPGFAENRHRTNAVEATFLVQRQFSAGRRLTTGAGAGRDWMGSSSLGDRDDRRAFGFGEVFWPLGLRASVSAGVRVDDYSTFGRAWTPSIAAAKWIGDVRLRASVARAFRVPTFTELYYRDPAHSARADLTAEHGWAYDGGMDWTRAGWTISASPFLRRDANVIDWVRERPTDLWQTTNVRDVQTRGLELSAAKRWTETTTRVFYAILDVDAPQLGLLSKYVLEYARHSFGAAASAVIAGGLRVAVQVDHRRRLNGQTYWLVGARLSRSVRRAEFFVDGSNLLNESYVEVPGVAMPGRWLTAGVMLR